MLVVFFGLLNSSSKFQMRSRVEREQSNLSAERERWQLVQRDLDRDTKERRQEIEFHQKRIGALVAQHKVELEQLTAVEVRQTFALSHQCLFCDLLHNVGIRRRNCTNFVYRIAMS
jgi:hypothetical protein